MPRIKKQKRWMPLIIKIVLASKIALLGAFYVGAKNPGPIRRLEDSLFYRNVPVAADSFPDPAGLEIMTEVNGNGAKEVYLAHPESRRRWSIAYDLLPRDLRVIERGLEERLNGRSAQRTRQEACESLDAFRRRVERENMESLAQYRSYDLEILDINGSVRQSPYESCERLIAVARNLKKLSEQNLAQRGGYFEEISNIMRGRRIPPRACERMLAEIRDGNAVLAGNIEMYNAYIGELSGIIARKNQNL